MTPWPGYGTPGPVALELRELTLAAYAIAALDCRAIGDCTNCGDEPCPDHQANLDLAAAFDAAYMQVAVGSPQWADLAITLAAGMN